MAPRRPSWCSSVWKASGHLPGLDELKAAGFLEALPPSGFDVPNPTDELAPDEDPYDPDEPDDLATGSADPREEA